MIEDCKPIGTYDMQLWRILCFSFVSHPGPRPSHMTHWPRMALQYRVTLYSMELVY